MNIDTIADLKQDPRNARKRGQRAETMIAKSLQEVGAARSIVIDENGRILAGNGTVEAAGQIGIEKVVVVPADGNTIVAVQRTGLTEEQKLRLALLDNRTGELAEWDTDVLAGLAASGDVELDDLWSDAELDALLTAVPSIGPPGSESENPYTTTCAVPDYRVTGPKPDLNALYDDTKCRELIAGIDKSDLPDDEKQFLRLAASRHIVFNFQAAAEYYAHSEAPLQRQFENSAMVIVDINDAIRSGWVSVTNSLIQILGTEYGPDGSEIELDDEE